MILQVPVRNKSSNQHTEEHSSEEEDSFQFSPRGGDITELLTKPIELPNIDFEEIHQFLQHPMVKSAFSEGVDLEVYTENIRNQLFGTELQSVEQMFLEERPKFTGLYNDLSECDTTLESIETVLNGFHKELETVNAQIRDMRIAKEYSQKLDNCDRLEKNLLKFLNEMELEQDLVKTIKSDEIDETFVQQLMVFDRKVDFVERQGNVLSAKQQQDFIATLMQTANSKVYQWLIQKVCGPQKAIESFQKRQHSFLKYTFLFKFLRKRNPNKSKEVVEKYVQIASNMYSSHFQKYGALIDTLKADVPGRGDLLGAAENNINNILKQGNRDPINRSNIYSIRGRANTLTNLEIPIPFPVIPESNQISRQIAFSGKSGKSEKTEKSKKPKEKYQYEYLFRCVNSEFVEMVKFEADFCREFFELDLSDQIFQKTTAIFSSNLSKYLFWSHDSVGILILQCVNHWFKSELNAKGIGLLDTYFDGNTRDLKARFGHIINLHLESCRTAIPFFLGSIDFCNPHYVIRRYAEFLASVLTLKTQHAEALKSFDVDTASKSVRVVMLQLLEKIAGSFNHADKKMIFYINNYDVIMTVVTEHGVSSPDTEFIDKLLQTEMEKYGEQQLVKHFSKLLRFVRAHMVRDKAGNVSITQPTCGPDTIKEILRSFAEKNYWKEKIDEINQVIMNNFPNFRNGVTILQKLLTSLFEHYKLLSDIISQYFKELRSYEYYVTIQDMRYKIRELTSVFE